MNLEGMSAVKCCETVLKASDMALMSEDIRFLIKSYPNGKYYKVSNLERRMRESDNIRSVKVKGKSYVKYRYINDEKQGQLI